MSSQIVFSNDDLRRLILSYIINKRCISCKRTLKNPKTALQKNYKDYRNYDWRDTENKYLNYVCNWCYYYVYEYP